MPAPARERARERPRTAHTARTALAVSVAAPFAPAVAGLRRGGIHKALSQLVRNKLLGYDNKKADGYRLTTSGYDFLALRTFNRRDTLVSLGNQIGVGKESDIYIVANSEGEQLVRPCLRGLPATAPPPLAAAASADTLGSGVALPASCAAATGPRPGASSRAA